jgi:hypothetical protein
MARAYCTKNYIYPTRFELARAVVSLCTKSGCVSEKSGRAFGTANSCKDLSDKNEKLSLTKNVGLITAFIHSAPICCFVLLLQTHADPTSGLLHFSTKKCTGINVVCNNHHNHLDPY